MFLGEMESDWIVVAWAQLFKTPGELRQLIYEECMWDFLARVVPWNPWNPPRSATDSISE